MKNKSETALGGGSAGPASVELPFTGFFFKVPSEIEVLMQLSPAELKVYLGVTHAIQRDRNGGLLAMSQIAKRANLSERHARKAIDALCQRRLLIRVNRATGAELTDKKEWNGRTVTYANPIQWWQKDAGNLGPTGQRSGPEDGDRNALRNDVMGNQPAAPDPAPTGEGNLRPVGERYLRPVGQRHSEYSEALEYRDLKHAQPQVEPSAFSGFSLSGAHDKRINGFASAKSAEGSPGRQVAGVETLTNQNPNADAPAKPAGAQEENRSMKAKSEKPLPYDATDAEIEDIVEALSAFEPHDLMDYEHSGVVPDWVPDAALVAAMGAAPEDVCAFLRQKAADGWQPPRWSTVPAVVRAAFTSTQGSTDRKAWTGSELQSVRDCGSAYMERDSPPENFASNCEFAANGHTAAEVIAYLESKYAHKRYRPGGASGPSHWNWFYAVIRNRFSAVERVHLPEQPAGQHPAHQASAEEMARGADALDSLVASYMCKCGAEIRHYTDRVEGTCTCSRANPISQAGAAQMPLPGKGRHGGSAWPEACNE